MEDIKTQYRISVGWGQGAKVAHALRINPVPPDYGNSMTYGFARALAELPDLDGTWWSPSTWKACEVPTSTALIAEGKLTQEEIDAYRQACDEAKSKGASTPNRPHNLTWCDRDKRQSHRKQDHWVAGAAVVSDLDWTRHDILGAEAHVALPEEIRSWVMTFDCDCPGNVIHSTPRGLRVVHIFTEPCTDPDTYRAAAEGVRLEMQGWLDKSPHAFKPGQKTGLSYDPTVNKDLARLLWAPNTSVNGKKRESTVTVLKRHELYDATMLAAMGAKAQTPRAAINPAPFQDEGSGSALDNELEQAISEFNRDHRMTHGVYPTNGTCPVCLGDNGGWGALPGTQDKWHCFHAGHAERPGVTIGHVTKNGGHVGDALDIYIWDTFRGKKSSFDRVEVLKTTKKPDGKTYYLDKKYEVVNMRGLDPEDFIYFMPKESYRFPDKDGSFDDGVSSKAFVKFLSSKGLNDKSIGRFLTLVPPVRDECMLFDAPPGLVERQDRTYLNMYCPSPIVAVKGDWSPIRQVILNLVGNDELGLEWYLDWLARPLQSLRKAKKPLKMLTTPVFHGGQGAGRGTLEAVISALYGTNNFAILGQSALDERYTDIIENKLFIVGNEIMSSTNRSQETANKLKMWITDPLIPLRPMYGGTRNGPNYFNLQLHSNDYKPTRVEGDDRRHTIFKVAGKIPAELGKEVAEDARHFGPLVSAFCDELMQRDVRVTPGQIFATEARKELIEVSRGSMGAFAGAMQELGFAAFTHHVSSSDLVSYADGGTPESPKRVIQRNILVAIYNAWCKENNYTMGFVGAASLYSALRDIGFRERRVKICKKARDVFDYIPGFLEHGRLLEGHEPFEEANVLHLPTKK